MPVGVRKMIDWHTHILPGMDDGSRDTAESVAMLEALAAQGVRTVIATPHFYANDESLATFLERRQQAMDRLQAAGVSEPRILLGAEVRYYQGISCLEDLKALRIQGSKLMLLEMPMTKWTQSMVRELIEMAGRSSIRIVLAHVERYFDLQRGDVWDQLAANGILFQVNASFFAGFFSRQKAITLLREGRIHFVGSDCHNLTSRPPKIDQAYDRIRNKLGDDFVNQMTECGYHLLGKH